MTTDQALELISQSLEAFDARLSGMDKRFVGIEANIADSAHAGEEASKSLEKLTQLYLSLSEGLERIEKLLGNYVEETQRLRQSSSKLVSEVRERLRDAR